MGSLPTGSNLKVTIIGGGLAGLITARVLREKHAVTVIEKFPGGHELGAAINVAPNGMRILERLGFDKAQAGSVVSGGTITLNHEGRVLQETNWPDIHDKFGGDWTFQHRADLWNEFLRLAEAPSKDLGLNGDPAKILWGAEAVDVDVESGDVKLADGTRVASDLVVGMYLHMAVR